VRFVVSNRVDNPCKSFDESFVVGKRGKVFEKVPLRIISMVDFLRVCRHVCGCHR